MRRPIADADVVAARKRPPKAASPELLEDWATLKGLPQYAYTVDWRHPECFAILRYHVIGKGSDEGDTYYRLAFDKILAKSPEYKRSRSKARDDRESPHFPAHSLCFTRKQVERWIEGAKNTLLHYVGTELGRLNYVMEEAQRQIKWMAEAMNTLNRGPLPEWDLERALSKVPATRPKRTSSQARGESSPSPSGE